MDATGARFQDRPTMNMNLADYLVHLSNILLLVSYSVPTVIIARVAAA